MHAHQLVVRNLLLTLLLTTAAMAVANDWPYFRGPDGNGVADAVTPVEWDATMNVAWTIDVPGKGWSAPIVIGNMVILTTTVPVGEAEGEELPVHKFEVRCYDLATGETLWEQVALEAAPRQPTHRDNTFASETPVTDGERVYAYFGMNGLFCYDLEGNLVWKKDLGNYEMDNGWGTSSGPVVVDGMIVVQIDNEQESHVVGLKADSGDEVWRVERPDEVSNWSTPIVWENSVRTEVVLAGKTVRSYEPTTGKELWSMEIGGRSSATPAAVGDVLYIGSENRSRRGGTPGGLFAVKAGASGSVDALSDESDDPHLVFADLQGAIGMASPLVVDNLVYIFERRGGRMRVHNAETGETVLQQRLPGGAAVWASPWVCEGRVYCLDEAGTTHVIAPGEEFELIGQNKLPGRFWSTPALSGGSLLLRSEDKLYCVRAAERG